MFRDIAFTPRQVVADDGLLERVYEASREGLKGDALAYRVGLLPEEYRSLKQLAVGLGVVEEKGRADAEGEIARNLFETAKSDWKAGLAVLQHKFGWVAEQTVNVNATHRISILDALTEAQREVFEGKYEDKTERIEGNVG